MLLTIKNLPANVGYADVKSLLLEKCGLKDLVLDNMSTEGNLRRVMVGVAAEEDAALIMRKINGFVLRGQQLYVTGCDGPQRHSMPFYTQSQMEQSYEEPIWEPPFVPVQQPFYNEVDINQPAFDNYNMMNNMGNNMQNYTDFSEDRVNPSRGNDRRGNDYSNDRGRSYRPRSRSPRPRGSSYESRQRSRDRRNTSSSSHYSSSSSRKFDSPFPPKKYDSKPPSYAKGFSSSSKPDYPPRSSFPVPGKALMGSNDGKDNRVRNETWRSQATAQLLKEALAASKDPLNPGRHETAFLKIRFRSRLNYVLDKLNKGVHMPPEFTIPLYRKKFPTGRDGRYITMLSMDWKSQLAMGKTEDIILAQAKSNPEGRDYSINRKRPAPTSKPPAAKIAKQDPGLPPHLAAGFETYKLASKLQAALNAELKEIEPLLRSNSTLSDADENCVDLMRYMQKDGITTFMKAFKHHVTKRLINYPVFLLVSLIPKSKVDRIKVYEFLDSYGSGVTYVKKPVHGDTFVTKFRTFEDYDTFCSIGECEIDNVQIEVKPLSLVPDDRSMKLQLRVMRTPLKHAELRNTENQLKDMKKEESIQKENGDDCVIFVPNDLDDTIVLDQTFETDNDVTCETENDVTCETENDITFETENDVTCETENDVTCETENDVTCETENDVMSETENVVACEANGDEKREMNDLCEVNDGDKEMMSVGEDDLEDF